jgi:hypothetical protein
MQVIGAAEGRAAPANRNPLESERAALQDSMFAYAGTYSVEDGKVIHHVDVSWNESWTGTDQTRQIEVSGNTLILSTRLTDPTNGTDTDYALVWDKVVSPQM